MKRVIPWLLVIYIAIVFIQSLFFKFSNSIETQLIFSAISQWLADLPVLAALAPSFKAYGGYGVGVFELIAAALLLYPATRWYGAIMAFFVISGAIFFHLITPLGVNIVIDEAGNRDGGTLFIMACGVWLSSVILIAWPKFIAPSSVTDDA